MNGQEKDNEVNNTSGTSYTAEYWQYDSRLGRRWNVDPVVKEWESPYATFGNCPIVIADPNGDTGGNSASQAPQEGDGEGDGDGGTDKNKVIHTVAPYAHITGSTSLYIYIHDGEHMFNSDITAEDAGEWDYVVANNFQEAEALLKESGIQVGSIQNMVIKTHGGGPGIMALGPKVDTYPVDVSDPQNQKSTAAEADIESLKYFKSLASNDATIFLTACSIASSDYYSKKTASFFIDGTNRKLLINRTLTSSTKTRNVGGVKMTYINFNNYLIDPSVSPTTHKPQFWTGILCYRWTKEYGVGTSGIIYNVKLTTNGMIRWDKFDIEEANDKLNKQQEDQ
jgi:hypothetical protein